MRSIYLYSYYLLIQHLLMQHFAGYKLFYVIRLFFVKRIIDCRGNNDVVKSKYYIGNGTRLSVGDRTQLGRNSKLGGKLFVKIS
jgi:maltose O-acetyltransferase